MTEKLNEIADILSKNSVRPTHLVVSPSGEQRLKILFGERWFAEVCQDAMERFLRDGAREKQE